MAKKRSQRATPAAADLQSHPAPEPRDRLLWIGGVLAVIAAFQAYSPVVNAPFLFDDDYLPFTNPNFPQALRAWMSGVRPLLMLSYWANFRVSGGSTPSYHIINILIHAANSLLVFVILRRLLALARVPDERHKLFAGFGAAVFLLHPLQTESVAYVASRSESLSALFLLAALAVFLLRPGPVISWARSAVVLLFFAAAAATKEHTLVLPALLALTDYYWNPGFRLEGLRRNWRLYLPVLILGMAGAVSVLRILSFSASAGFRLRDITWYQYFFTECRALFVYLRLFLFPAGQVVDYDFPVSHNLLEHGAFLGLVILLIVAAAAILWRRKYPLASYGFLFFLVLLAPTSSFVPIQDPVAERRMYLPVMALMLIAIEFLRRMRTETKTLSAIFALVVLALGGATFLRNQVWASPIALWEDTVEKSPAKPRAHFQLAFAYFQENRCDLAVSHYAAAAKIQPPSHDLLVDWALAYDCLNQPAQALEKLRLAAEVERTAHVYSMIGMEYAKQSLWPAALDALSTAQQIDPNYAMLYVYRGGVHLNLNEAGAAADDYRKALALDPGNRLAREGLTQAEQRLRGPG